jgi:hypothetical protein
MEAKQQSYFQTSLRRSYALPTDPPILPYVIISEIQGRAS